MSNRGIGLLGRKIGMTRIFEADGRQVPVTVVKAGPCPILRVKRSTGPDGYDALQVAFEPCRAKVKNRPDMGQFKAANLPPHRVLREFRLDEPAELSPGDVLRVDMFRAGEVVDLRGRRKGRGFQGVMRRHNFGGLRATHGTKRKDRSPGSIGASADPSRVFPGRRMAGRMGATTVTVKGLQIVSIDPERHLLMIRGAVPGPAGGLVEIRKRVMA